MRDLTTLELLGDMADPFELGLPKYTDKVIFLRSVEATSDVVGLCFCTDHI